MRSAPQAVDLPAEYCSIIPEMLTWTGAVRLAMLVELGNHRR